MLLSTMLAAPALSSLPADRIEPPSHIEDDYGRRLHFGLEIRGDFWRHAVRPAIGISGKSFDLTALLDPFVLVDGKQDVDLVAGWWFCPRSWRLALGWRNSSTRIGDGRRFGETLLLGLDAAMPSLNGRYVRATFGVMLALDLVRHGGGVPTRTLPLGSFADLSDYVNVTFNVRFELSPGF